MGSFTDNIFSCRVHYLCVRRFLGALLPFELSLYICNWDSVLIQMRSGSNFAIERARATIDWRPHPRQHLQAYQHLRITDSSRQRMTCIIVVITMAEKLIWI